MSCDHELWERHSAVADGMCPQCLADKIERLKAERDAERRHSQNCTLAMVRANDQALEAMARAEAAEKELEQRPLDAWIETIDSKNAQLIDMWKARAEAAEKMLHGLEAQLRVSGNHDG